MSYASLNACTSCDQRYSPITQSVGPTQTSFVQPHDVCYSPISLNSSNQNMYTSHIFTPSISKGPLFLSSTQETSLAVSSFPLNNEENLIETNLNLSNIIDCNSDSGPKMEAHICHDYTLS